MQAILNDRYARLETALDTLLDSIASYNPSTTAADELVAADHQVNEALTGLATHHEQYSRILALRDTSEALDKQIKSMVMLLADTRKRLLAVPSHAARPDIREVNVDDVLSYARFISKTTVPPTDSARDGMSQPQPTTAITESSKVIVTDENAVPTDGSIAQSPSKTENGHVPSALNQEAKAMLDPVSSQLPFVPWPTQEVIRAGALGEIQGMVERGQDPAQITTSSEIEEARQRAEAEANAQQRAKDDEELARAQRQRQNLEQVGGADAQRRPPADDVFNPDD